MPVEQVTHTREIHGSNFQMQIFYSFVIFF